MLSQCLEELRRVAPDHYETRRVEAIAAATRHPWRFAFGWAAVGAVFIGTLVHAVWRSLRRIRPSSSAIAPLVGALVGAANTLPAAQYVESQQQRLDYIHQWNAAFADNRLDAVLKPGASVDGADRTGAAANNPEGGVQGDYSWADVAGLPVASVTVGRSAATGLPFGIQIGGGPHTESKLLQIAIDYQAHYGYSEASPPGLA